MRSSRAVWLALALTALPVQAREPSQTRRVSLDVVRAPVEEVLRGLAEMGGLNLVLSEEVRGTVTLTLRDVPWTQAFQGVLVSQGLGMERKGNILRVAPLRVLQEEAETRARLAQARKDEGPLRTWLLPVSHARAAELLPQVQALLSPRGRVSVDTRTNTLIVTDVEAPVLP
ncbi:secretin and TonB N-terminal domain-containing protein [Cystobacter fuscus]|uniref:secretin and TonB N-terminal domain-containing protein n=1 Tax=Cystobacter fuscus TaxID=43 RepID=UPI002B2E833D|nr:pilus assembly protein PilQ [Cystobacter fuscus]